MARFTLAGLPNGGVPYRNTVKWISSRRFENVETANELRIRLQGSLSGLGTGGRRRFCPGNTPQAPSGNERAHRSKVAVEAEVSRQRRCSTVTLEPIGLVRDYARARSVTRAHRWIRW
jgi:hypothetical protein